MRCSVVHFESVNNNNTDMMILNHYRQVNVKMNERFKLKEVVLQ